MIKRFFVRLWNQNWFNSKPPVYEETLVKPKDDTTVYNDKVPKGFLTNDHLPDIIFERDVMLYNAGVDTVKNVYRVIATPKVKCKNV